MPHLGLLLLLFCFVLVFVNTGASISHGGVNFSVIVSSFKVDCTFHFKSAASCSSVMYEQLAKFRDFFWLVLHLVFNIES